MVPIADNTLYYTLSTVAQSIAAAIAFLGAFVLFKIQAAEARLGIILPSLANQVTREDATIRMLLLIRSGQYKKALEFIKVDPKSQGQEFESAVAEAIQAIEAIKHTRNSFLVILYAAIVLIAVSIIGLALIDQIKISPLLNCAFGVYILFSICVLVSMAKLIRDMIYE
jgi:hypothetical protein